jgi:hypothetical protein
MMIRLTSIAGRQSTSSPWITKAPAACVHAETATGPLAMAFGALAPTAARPALHPRGRDHRDPVSSRTDTPKTRPRASCLAPARSSAAHPMVLHAGPPLPRRPLDAAPGAAFGKWWRKR